MMILTKETLRWRGKSLDEMSREELVEALLQACNQVMQYQDPIEMRVRALGRVEIIKRGDSTKSQPI